MSRENLDEVLRYLRPHTRWQAIVLHQGPIHKFQTADQVKEHFIRLCKNTPYSERTTITLTLYDRLQSLGVLNAFLADPVVEEIGCFLEVFEMQERERTLQNSHYSFHEFPVQFHRSLLQMIFQHIKRLQKLLERYDVKEQHIAPYLNAAREQMLREIRALLPLYPFGDTDYNPETMTQSWDVMILCIYDILSEALKAAGVNRGRKELTIQLTKVVCSPSEFLHSG